MEKKLTQKEANRRIAQRIKPQPGTITLQCRQGVTGLGSDVATTLLDISETGARLVVTQEFALQQEVEVEFESPKLRHIVRRISNVRWQLELADGKFCIGVEFQKRLGYMEWQRLSTPK